MSYYRNTRFVIQRKSGLTLVYLWTLFFFYGRASKSCSCSNCSVSATLLVTRVFVSCYRHVYLTILQSRVLWRWGYILNTRFIAVCRWTSRKTQQTTFGYEHALDMHVYSCDISLPISRFTWSKLAELLFIYSYRDGTIYWHSRRCIFTCMLHAMLKHRAL